MVQKVKRRYQPSQTSERIQKDSEGNTDTVGRTVHKFKVKGTVVTLPGGAEKRSNQWLKTDF